MLSSSLTYQLAQMALENQYDRTALCWDIDGLDYPGINLPEAADSAPLFLLSEEDFAEEVDLSPARAEYELQQTKSLYTFHLLIARLVFRNDPDANGTLRLSGKRKESLSGWTYQATYFYADLGYIAPAMAHYGISLDELRQAKAMLEAVIDYYL